MSFLSDFSSYLLIIFSLEISSLKNIYMILLGFKNLFIFERASTIRIRIISNDMNFFFFF